MDRRYTILAILLIIAAFGLLIVPHRGSDKEITPDKLLSSVYDQARFLSTDNITERIIGGDPTLQLIDVRPAGQFNKFALPGAVNIPVDSILSPAWKEILHQPGKDKVFYSNGSIEADKAWQVCTRTSVPRVFVMKGGLNYWFSTIIKGIEPAPTAPGQETDLYSFRQAARQYFIGSNSPGTGQVDRKAAESPEKVKVSKKTPSVSSGGGC
jgi:sulfur-carrier protein adenylyltransferase/sulfurtransferase